MVITWYGQACFKIQSGDLVVAIDPFSKEIGFTPPRFKTDIVLVTHGHFDHANWQALAGDPFAITGPGEYEVKGVDVMGIETYHDTARGLTITQYSCSAYPGQDWSSDADPLRSPLRDHLENRALFAHRPGSSRRHSD